MMEVSDQIHLGRREEDKRLLTCLNLHLLPQLDGSMVVFS